MSVGGMEASAAEGAGASPAGGLGPVPEAEGSSASREETAPCLRCGVPLPVRLMGCKGGHCPNCSHPYPHGDCSD